MLTDLHTHTQHSPDASPQSVTERVAAAEQLGLRVMGISDHVEINRWYPAARYHAEETEEFLYDSRSVFAASVSEVAALQRTERMQQSPVRLVCGAEVGQIPQDIALSQRLYRDPRVDFVIGSVHELPEMADFYFLHYDEIDIPALIGAYFEEELRLAQTDCYDTLGHLTYGLRYLPNRAAFDLSPYAGVIDEIFRTVIAHGKALELNGSGLKYDMPFTDPAPQMIRRFRELGGQYLTLGTDAHDTQYLGFGMEQLEQIARDAGFSHVTYFVRHEPVQIPL